MRNPLPPGLTQGRVLRGEWASKPEDGGYGMFLVMGPCGKELKIIASGADDDDKQSQGWEHVSVSTAARVPIWREMCFVKDLFWEPEDCVVQFHPPASEYVNNHPRCLHLWRHKTLRFPLPPSIMVGIQDLGELNRETAAALRLIARRA